MALKVLQVVDHPASAPSTSAKIIQGRFKAVDTTDRTETITLLRDLADDLENDRSVRGAVVVIDRENAKPGYVAARRYARGHDSLAIALYRIANWIAGR